MNTHPLALLKSITQLPHGVQGTKEANMKRAVVFSIDYVEVLNEVLTSFNEKFNMAYVEAEPTYFPVNGFQDCTLSTTIMLYCPPNNLGGFEALRKRLSGEVMNIRGKYNIGALCDEANPHMDGFNFPLQIIIKKGNF